MQQKVSVATEFTKVIPIVRIKLDTNFLFLSQRTK